ncbi:Hpt domain-containing protein [Pseudomonas extremaustralis]|jgi:HPt (histidine-containing phosphotransfer) domain-containing protein|uniref:Hpt domain-containing protein n=1 Tax=Pseudomonas extremaustralis TaxID=359110 RepID=A0ABY0NKM8_9PSED|nr:hypothetical protein PE143B_0108980 [Pseudomonas extremaustralis 14-3 substr. 14-3b]SDF63418.1 Hpt domain-containing protein [Pseudomonas extremaustralis]
MVTRAFFNPVPVLTSSLQQIEGRAPCPARFAWPTRTSLLEIFGSDEVVNRVLVSLMNEAREDGALLEQALASADAPLVMERLHRLVGSLAFVGGADLERHGEQLIAQVQVYGLVASTPQLHAFQRNLQVYITYLSRL